MIQLRLQKSSISQLREWRLECARENGNIRISDVQRLREVNSGRQITLFMAKGRRVLL